MAYSDTSRDAFERALQSMRESLPQYLVGRLQELLDSQQIHDPAMVIQAIERQPSDEELGNAG